MSLVGSKPESARNALQTVRTWLRTRSGATSLLLGAALCVTLSVTGCASPPEHDLAIESRDVAEATIAIKAAMVEAGDVDAAAIRVSLDGDLLVLDGFAASEAEKSRAGAIATEHGGGREVRNEIVVQ